MVFSVRQKIKGDLNGYYILTFSKEIFLNIAIKMLKTHVEDVDDITIDAVQEFVNITIGHICSSLSTQGLNVEAEPPKCFDLDQLGKDAAEKGIEFKDISIVPLVFPDETAEMTFLVL